MRQGVREAASNRIGDIGHDDRNGRVRPPHRLDGLGGRRGDDVHLQAKQVGGEFRQALLATIGVPHLDYDVLTLDIAELPQSPPQPRFRVGRREVQYPDPRNFLHRLGTGRGCPSRRRAEKPDNLPPPHEHLPRKRTCSRRE